MYFTELSGRVHQSALDGSGQKQIAKSNSASGVTLVHMPVK
jgi:hypothetical protein